MATFRFELTNKPNRNKKYMLMLCVTVAGKRKRIKTPIELDKRTDFNSKCRGTNWVRANVLDAKALNAQLEEIMQRAKVTYRELDRHGEVTSTKVTKEMNTEVISPSFMAFIRERAQIIYNGGGFRNWKKYNGFINKLDAFRKKRRMSDITMADLNVTLLNRFDGFLRQWKNERTPEKLLHPNTIEVQFNIFHALVNKAIEEGLLDASKNPFLVFKYRGVTTVKEKLEEPEMARIIGLELEEGSLEWHCRNYFLFSFYCAGIRAADLIQLRWSNISETGRLHYQMGKNHKERDLILIPEALQILQQYQREDALPNDYIFPLLSNDAEYASFATQADKDRMRPELKSKMLQDVSSRNALINKYLKKIALKAEISKPLSMHISRHTFAHIAQESGVESAAVKDILGHSNLATTERYMGSFDTTKTDEVLRRVFTQTAFSTAPQISTSSNKEELALSLLKEMTPEQIMTLLASIHK